MQWSRGRGEGQGTVHFSHPPMTPDVLEQIQPLGMMVGAHVTPIDHQYYVPKDMFRTKRDQFPVFAPADGFVVDIQHRTSFEGSSETKRDYDDYRLVIEHTGTFYSYYDLLTSVDKAVMDKMRPEGRGQFTGRAAVKAGQEIGRIGTRTLDFAAVNLETTLKGFVVPEHYLREPWKIHTVDPFDYFESPLRDELLKLNPRTAEPRGGKIDYDVDGRLIGNWFREGTNGYAGAGDKRGYWMGHLAVVPHFIHTKSIIVSLGDYEGRSRQFGVKGNAPDPATVDKETGVVKYELVDPVRPGSARPFEGERGAAPRVQGVVLFQLVEDRKLRVETFPGKGADEVRAFTSAAVTYER